jgi:hypothetical protein
MSAVSITEAAVRLTALGDRIDRSTLSRYLAQHAEALPVERRGKSGLIDFDLLLAHRRENVRISSDVPAPMEVIAPSVSAAPKSKFTGAQISGTARKAAADAEMREMDIAERRRELTPRIEVDRAAREAVGLMTAAFDVTLEASVSDASVKYGWDERQLRIVLKAYVREGLATFHRELLDRIEALGRDDGAVGVGAGE